jgi:hypothetical protein
MKYLKTYNKLFESDSYIINDNIILNWTKNSKFRIIIENGNYYNPIFEFYSKPREGELCSERILRIENYDIYNYMKVSLIEKIDNYSDDIKSVAIHYARKYYDKLENLIYESIINNIKYFDILMKVFDTIHKYPKKTLPYHLVELELNLINNSKFQRLLYNNGYITKLIDIKNRNILDKDIEKLLDTEFDINNDWG